MRATGIIRRIDDLGRVVIPKEIRRTLRIREGDPLEIFVDREGEVILKKYSPINELGDFATEYAEALFEALQLPILICDRDEVVALAGVSRKEYLNKRIGSRLEYVIEDRAPDIKTESEPVEIVAGEEKSVDSYCIYPIIANGDPIGCVMTFAENNEQISDAEIKVIHTAASFLAKQME
ncbi:MAG TPA: stage V sporulation protein T [Bacillota bacterium]|nr:stage V sporulation protein T [Bacillota bacterium]